MAINLLSAAQCKNAARRGQAKVAWVFQAVVLVIFSSQASAQLSLDLQPGGVVRYHGFEIDGRNTTGEQIAAVSPSLIKQLEIVESVGVPTHVLDFFRSVPIVLEPGLRQPPAIYTTAGAKGTIHVLPTFLPVNKPILLHEFLHAYHYKILGRDTNIVSGFERAKNSNEYPAAFQTAHFLENPGEYFAVLGTIYLFGVIKQPPFECATVLRADVPYVEFLESIFGQHPCNPAP